MRVTGMHLQAEAAKNVPLEVKQGVKHHEGGGANQLASSQLQLYACCFRPRGKDDVQLTRSSALQVHSQLRNHNKCLSMPTLPCV